MAQKNATPSKAQQAILTANGLDPMEWVVIKELNHSMIIRQRVGTEVRMIDKKEDPDGSGKETAVSGRGAGGGPI